MRLYNNDPADPLTPTADENWVASLKDKQFVIRDCHSFGCPRVGGWKDESHDWASSYEQTLGTHAGRSWRIVNKKDPITDLPPVVPSIPIILPATSWWNHIGNGYRISDTDEPVALGSESHTKPGVHIHLGDRGDHGVSYSENGEGRGS